MDDPESPPRVEVRLLGPFEVRAAGVAVSLKPQALLLLALLAVKANQPVSRAAIADVVWDSEMPDVKDAANQIQVHVRAIRDVLSRGGVRRDAIEFLGSGRYKLHSPPVQTDVRWFDSQVAEAGQRLQAGLPAEASRILAAALEIGAGVALDGLGGKFAQSESARLEERKLAVLLNRIDIDLCCERYADLVPELAGLVGGRGIDDRFRMRLMLALHGSGRTPEALAIFRGGREILKEEFGLEPGQDLRATHQAILADKSVPHILASLMPLARRPQLTSPTQPELAPSLEVKYSLPQDTAAFTGRNTELDRITAAVTDAARAGEVVAIHALGGMPGVGKTALAVHAAHLLKDLFPDRQLFIDLHGHTPGQDSMFPEVALAGLLAAAGVDARSLPADLAGRAALWRDRMAGQRVLLVLDNAASSAQVAPLLPGGQGCLVMVTSRRHLGDLPGSVVQVQVDALTPGQAQEMLTRLAPRAQADPAAVAELVRLVGFLPLAISLLARVYARHPSWTMADLIAETQASLLALTAENESVAAAFEVSYRYLTPVRQRFFRHLALHPGTRIDAYASAALAGLPLQEAAGLLDDLHGEGLLTETGYRRYGMHDLIRRYASDLAAADPAADRDQALGRLLDYYQHTAAAAQALLARRPRTMPAPAAPPAAVPGLPDREQALAWARTERGNLLACLDHATRSGQHAQVIALTASLAGILQQDGPSADAITLHETAVRAARGLGDGLGEGNALSELGIVQRQKGDYQVAAETLEAALGIYRDLGDRLGEGNALSELGIVQRQKGDYQVAAETLEAALGIYRDLGDRLGQANATSGLGSVRLLTGNYRGAAEALESALGIYRNLADRLGEGNALYGLGVAQRLTGNYQGAVETLQAARGIYRDLGDRRGQGNALGAQGSVRLLTGDYQGAAEALEAALGVYRELGDRGGEGSALNELGVVRRLTGDYQGAAEALEAALGIFRDLGHRLGVGNALIYLGAVRRQTGDYQGAAEALEPALGIFRDLGDPGGEAEALNEGGTLHRLCGDLGQAAACHRQALTLARKISSSLDEASALAGLGRCALADGCTASAVANLRQAREIFLSIGAAEAQAVAAELASLADVGRPAERHRMPAAR